MNSPVQKSLKHFYIPEEQSFYLLSHKDAQKLKDWFSLCHQQLALLGYRDTQYLGKGAFGFVFAGTAPDGQQLVFKFSRITLPQHVQDRLEDEAFMLSMVEHPHVPALVEFQRIGKQSILVMERARGEDLEQYSLRRGPLAPRLIVKIIAQLTDVLRALRNYQQQGTSRPIVHGDIKPSNIVFDEYSETVQLIDWGSSVFAQLDESGQHVGSNVMDLMSGDLQQTNARLGDVYFIGDEQLNGALSSPRFDEQGLASTIYALASGQSCRFGRKVVHPNGLGLPRELAHILTALMDDNAQVRRQAGDYLFRNIHALRNIVFSPDKPLVYTPFIPCWVHNTKKDIETVVYSSRKSFLREEGESSQSLRYLNDAQFERYYKNYMQGMGDTEKAFIAAVGRLGRYPVVGGLAVRWQPDGVYIDSSLNLFDERMRASFEVSVNNMVTLARAIHRTGIFKCCLFNAKDTLHIEREDDSTPFIPDAGLRIPFEVSQLSLPKDESKMHSYFEDGDDPDELLQLPPEILGLIARLNGIHHTGCVIFEALPTHLKIHSYYTLLDHTRHEDFSQLLAQLVSHIPKITGLGISGFMKLPYKDTRFFTHTDALPEKFYPRNPLNQQD